MTDALLTKWSRLLNEVTVLIDVGIEVDFVRDRKDSKFVSCALVSEADFLITGDLDFSQAQKLLKTTIISISLFKKLVCDCLS